MTEENTLAAEPAQAVEAVASDAPVEKTETAETPKPDAPEAVEKAETPPEDDGDEKRRNRHPAKDRIARLTAQKRELEKENERLKSMVSKPPKEGDFEDYSDFERAKVRHAAREAMAEDYAERAKAQEQQIAAEIEADWSARVQEFKARAPDFEAKISNPALPINQNMADVIKQMDDGAAVAYHLAGNVHEAVRIAQLHPVAAAAELGRVAERLKSPPRRTASTAPPPVAPVVGSGGPVTKSPADMSQSEYNAWRRGK